MPLNVLRFILKHSQTFMLLKKELIDQIQILLLQYLLQS